METPVVTFLGYITYKYFLKTTVELKPRQRVPCVDAGLQGRRAALPPVLLPWGGGSLWPPNQAQEAKSSAPALPGGLPGGAVCLSLWGVCLSVGLQLLCSPCVVWNAALSSGGAGGWPVPPLCRDVSPQELPWGVPGDRGWHSLSQDGSTDPSLGRAGGAAVPPVWLLQLL